MARVVGNTGAMARPEMNTSAAAPPAWFVRSIRNVVMAMATEAASRTRSGETWIRTGETADAPHQQSQCESQRKDIERARLGNTLRDEVARQPVPHAHFARHVKEQQKPSRNSSGRPRIGPAWVSTKPEPGVGAGIAVAACTPMATMVSTAIV